MNYTIARMGVNHHGFSLSDPSGKSILQIDGNRDVNIPIALIHLDAHSVYGLSHPSIISQILGGTRQKLLTTKKLAHTLYEHGMKAAYGTLVVGDIPLQTTPNTFYQTSQTLVVTPEVTATVVSYSEDVKAYLELTILNQKYIITYSNVSPVEGRLVNLDLIRDYLNLNE